MISDILRLLPGVFASR